MNFVNDEDLNWLDDEIELTPRPRRIGDPEVLFDGSDGSVWSQTRASRSVTYVIKIKEATR